MEPAFRRVPDSLICTTVSAFRVFSPWAKCFPLRFKCYDEKGPPPSSTVIVLHPPLPPGRAGWIHCLSHCRGRPEQRWGEHEQSLLIITWLFHRSSINRDRSPLLYQTCSAALGKLQIPQLCQIKSKPFSWYKYIKSTVVFVAVCQSSAVCPTTDWISLQEARF